MPAARFSPRSKILASCRKLDKELRALRAAVRRWKRNEPKRTVLALDWIVHAMQALEHARAEIERPSTETERAGHKNKWLDADIPIGDLPSDVPDPFPKG